MKNIKPLTLVISFLLLSILTLPLQSLAQKVKKVESEEALKLLQKKNYLIVDGRDSCSFKAGHIEGAINIDAFSPQAKDQVAALRETKRIFVYCRTHKRSDQIIQFMQQAGFRNRIVQMKDGYTGWSSNKLPIVEDEKKCDEKM